MQKDAKRPPPPSKTSVKPSKPPPAARGASLASKGSSKPSKPPPAARGAPPSVSGSVRSKAPPPASKAPPPASKAPPPASKAPPPASKAPPPASKAPPPTSKAPAPTSKAPSTTGAPISSLTPISTQEFKVAELNDDAILAQICGPGGIEVKDRKWRFKTYPSCFLGSELTTMLVDKKLAPNRESAVKLGERLRQTGAFDHVTSGQRFQDGFFFYRFKEKGGRNRGMTNAKTLTHKDSTAVESPMFKSDVPNQDFKDFIKGGYALKRMGVGPDSLHFWEVKYFVLSGVAGDKTKHRLEFYASHEKGRRQGNMTITNQSSCMTIPRDAFADGGHKLMFGLTDKPEGRTIVMDAESKTVLDEWLEAFSSVGAINKGLQCERINSASLKEGWVKKAPEKIGVWHRRYLILLPNVLMYYKWKRDKRPLGAIPLMKNTQIKEDDKRVSTFVLIPDPNAVSDSNVNPAGRKYVITCYDDFLLKVWVKAIQEAIAKLR